MGTTRINKNRNWPGMLLPPDVRDYPLSKSVFKRSPELDMLAKDIFTRRAEAFVLSMEGDVARARTIYQSVERLTADLEKAELVELLEWQAKQNDESEDG